MAKLDEVQRIKSNIGHYDHDAKAKILRMVKKRVEDIGLSSIGLISSIRSCF